LEKEFGCRCASPSRSATRTDEFDASKSKDPSNFESSTTKARLNDVLTWTFNSDESTVESWRSNSVIGLSSHKICASYSGMNSDGGDGGGFARLKSEELPPGFAAKLIVAEKGLLIECKQESVLELGEIHHPLEDFMNKLVGPF